MSTHISVAAAERQAFGVHFNHSSRDATLARSLKERDLELKPHPIWNIPEVIDWNADPFGDLNWRAQFHMLRWIDPLRRRAEKGDAGAGAAWQSIAKSWVDWDSRNSARLKPAWMDMVDGIRALALCAGIPFMSRRQSTTPTWLTDSIRTHADWLSDASHLGHSNHALHQHQGLLVCGAVLGDQAAIALAQSRLEELYSTAYDDQAINSEGAIAYHLSNYNWWKDARRRLEVEGIEVPAKMEMLDSVPVELAHATKPDGRFVGIGDTDGGSPKYIDHPATRWVSTAGADGEPPEDLIRIYDAGYLFARSGWGDQERDYADETYWSASFGSAKRVHGHPDGGSITYSSMGTEWITDPGKFQYGSSEMRDFCVSRASHSLPAIDRPYDPASFVACTRREITDSYYDVTFTDSGYQGVTVTRRVVYSVTGEYLVVIDNVASTDECTAVQNWQCGPGVSATPVPRGYALSAGDAHAAVLFAGSAPRREAVSAQERPTAGWVSTGWKQREAAPALRFTKTGRRFRFITLVAAGFKGHQPTLETVEGTPAGQIRLRVDSGRVAEQIVIAKDGVSFAPYTADANVNVKAPPTEASDLPELDALDHETRARVFTLTRRARKTAWDSPDAATRGSLARDLENYLGKYSVPRGIDLGLRATISDLRCISHAKVDRREVLKHRPGLINWEAKDSFRTSHVNAPTASVYGAISDLPPLNRPTMVTYALGSLVLPALVTPAPGDTLTVMLQTAVDRARTHLPLFQRVRFQGELGAGPFVAFADPTLDLSSELRLGWYLGDEEIDLPKSIAKAIVKLGQHLGTEKVVLQGGSGGGFAALQIGAHIPGAHVVAANPQTDLRRYNAKAYRAAMVSALGRKDVGNKSELIPRISVMRRLQDLSSQLDVTLVMNSGDVYHERNHAAPLREAAEHLDGVTIRDVSFDLGPGHKGLSNDLYGQVMLAVYERIGTVSPALSSRADG